MSDQLEDGSFMFTSESVGEGHPGESANAKGLRIMRNTTSVTFSFSVEEV